MQEIKVEVRELIATVTLARPPVNAFTSEMYLELTNRFIELGEREDVAVIVLRAEGKTFCGGNDIGEFKAYETRPGAERSAKIFADATNAIWTCKKPVIAAVQGHAMGGGMAVVAVSDFIIAGAGVLLGVPEIKLGVPAAGVFASLMAPMHKAKWMAYTGNPLPAEEFERYGSIMKVVPRDQVWAEAEAFAKELAASCYRAVGIYRQTFNQNLDLRIYDKSLAEQHSFFDHMLGSHDYEEAVAAFKEKRKPVFNGK